MHLHLRTSARRLTAAVVMVAAAIALPVATAAPSYANSVIEATGVSLNTEAGCADADLDLEFTSNTVDTETGHATNLAGDVLDDFTQNSGLSDETGYVGYGISVDPEQPDGTIIGSYASIGVTPMTAANTAEFFVLYQCNTDGPQTVLSSCFGNLGECPTTAAEAITIEVTPSDPVAGGEITVSGLCVGSVAQVTLGATGDPSDTFADSGLLTTGEGTYTATFTLPLDAPPSIVATVYCGDEDVLFGTASVTVPVGSGSTDTTAGVTTTTVTAAPPAAVPATASFTG